MNSGLRLCSPRFRPLPRRARRRRNEKTDRRELMAPTNPSPAVPRISLADALSSARETRALHVGPGALREVAAVFRAQFPGARAVVVADEVTFSLCGRTVD